jgi:hypothetical protein
VGTVNANFLPNTTGLSLGSQVQKWLLNGQQPMTIGSPVTVTFSSTPLFSSTGGFTVFAITLSGNVTSSTLTVTSPGVLIFQITQDGTGGHTFTWPANVIGGFNIDTTASINNFQYFYFDGTNAHALTSGVSQ